MLLRTFASNPLCACPRSSIISRTLPVPLAASRIRTMSSKFTAVSTPDAPSAIGPYSQAIKSNLGLLFCSGQVPFDPKTMEFVPGGAAEQTEQVFTNIEAVLKAENLTLNDVIKATVFIKDMGDFGTINTVYAKRFGDHKPARSCVEVARLPKDALVEIEVIAQWK